MIYIYHHTDNDGYGSAAVVNYYLIKKQIVYNWNDSNITFIPYCYKKLDTFVPINNKFTSEDMVFIVDLSVSESTKSKFIDFCSLLYSTKTKLYWIDHHTSSMNLINNDSQFVNILKTLNVTHYIDTYYCAMFNCWIYLLPGFAVPEIVRVIDDYDCWKLKLAGTKEFQIAFGINDSNLPDNSKWQWLFSEPKFCLSFLEKTINTGKHILNYLKYDDTLNYNNYSYESTLCGFNCVVLNRKRNSDIFVEHIKDYDLVVSYIFNGDRYSYSIYSVKDNVDCSKIAELFGGGGHKGASGFSTNKLIVSKTNNKFNIIYKIKDLIRKLRYKLYFKKSRK